MIRIRVIAPSDSWKTKKEDLYTIALQRFEAAGCVVSFGDNVKSVLHLGTASAELRAKDLNDAFADNNVDAIIALHGGFSVNEILPLIDWDIVKNNPKPVIGYSDISVLVNAIYAKTGNITYLGPNFGTNGNEDLWQYTLDGVMKVLSNKVPFRLKPSAMYVDDKNTYNSAPWVSIQSGTGEGILLGGNIQSFFLLQGTEYQPKFDTDIILAIEDDSLSREYTLHGFSRNLDSILQLPGARHNIKGIIIGRFEIASRINDSELLSVIRSKNLTIPVITNVDFGHTTPIATLPIGGILRIVAGIDKADIEILSL